MKSIRRAIIVTGILGLVVNFWLVDSVYAGGGAGGINGCCIVENPGAGAIALNGTMAVDYMGSNSDVKLRLERGGKIGFFQLNLIGDIDGLDNFEIACLVLNPYEPQPSGIPDINFDAVVLLVQDILDTFFPDSGMTPEDTGLVITRKSISFTDGNSGGPVGQTGRSAAMGDITIYVVDASKARYEPNGNCR
jgi:hypothetical protein